MASVGQSNCERGECRLSQHQTFLSLTEKGDQRSYNGEIGCGGLKVEVRGMRSVGVEVGYAPWEKAGKDAVACPLWGA